GPAPGFARAGPHAAASLRLRPPADGLSRRPAAADVGIPQHHQEQRGRAHHRPDGAHGARPRHAGVLFSGVRGVHGRDPDLHRHQYRGDVHHAPGRALGGGARLHRGGSAAAYVLRPAMFGNFDFDVIARSLPYLFYDGMTFTLTLTALATAAGLALGTLLALARLSSIRLLSV